MKLKIITASIIAYTSNGLFDLYSLESLIGFFLALSVGLGGKIGWDSRTKSITGLYVIRRFFIALMVGFLIDLYAYDNDYSATLRIGLVCLGAALSELILGYVIENHKTLFNKILNRNDTKEKDNSK